MGDITALGGLAGGIAQGYAQQQQAQQTKQYYDLLKKKTKADIELAQAEEARAGKSRQALENLFYGQKYGPEAMPEISEEIQGPPEPGLPQKIAQMRMSQPEAVYHAAQAGIPGRAISQMFGQESVPKTLEQGLLGGVITPEQYKEYKTVGMKPGAQKEVWGRPEQDKSTGLWLQKSNLGGYKTVSPPKAAGAGKEADPEKTAKAEQTLRKEFISESNFFKSIKNSYNTIQANANAATAAGDMGLIFAIMKMFDPTSVVRESEYATAQQAAAITERAKAAMNRVMTGEKLSDAQRKDFVETAGRVYEVAEKDFKRVHGRYGGLARSYGYSPERIVYDYSVEKAGVAQDLPEGTIIRNKDGTRSKIVNGEFVPIGD